MSSGFQIDFSGWNLGVEHCVMLDRWASKYFVDFTWSNRVLLGWLSEPSSVGRMRELAHNNLKNWKCTKLRRYQRQWVCAVTAADFCTLAGRPPKPLRNDVLLILSGVCGRAVQKADAILTRREVVMEKERGVNRRLMKSTFATLLANAPRLSKKKKKKKAARTAKVDHLKAHLAALARARDEAPPDADPIYLPEDWEKVSPEEVRARRDRGVKRRLFGSFRSSCGSYWRPVEESREADLLRQIEEGRDP